MADVDRAELLKAVYRKLADRQFRECLTAQAADGTHPITVALRDDLVVDLLTQITAAGGGSNVVVPALNGFVVIAMFTDTPSVQAADPEAMQLKHDCTVGLLVARVMFDGVDGADLTYNLVGPGTPQRGRAELVALGG